MVVRYRVREWSKPNTMCGPLAVFVTKKAAMAFLEPFTNKLWYRIYQCKFIPSNLGQQFYQDDEGHLRVGNDYNCSPSSTQFANAVKLLKKV
jgi:hypothetical protein